MSLNKLDQHTKDSIPTRQLENIRDNKYIYRNVRILIRNEFKKGCLKSLWTKILNSINRLKRPR